MFNLGFSKDHQTEIHSINPLGWINGEISPARSSLHLCWSQITRTASCTTPEGNAVAAAAGATRRARKTGLGDVARGMGMLQGTTRVDTDGGQDAATINTGCATDWPTMSHTAPSCMSLTLGGRLIPNGAGEHHLNPIGAWR